MNVTPGGFWSGLKRNFVDMELEVKCGVCRLKYYLVDGTLKQDCTRCKATIVVEIRTEELNAGRKNVNP